MTTPTVTRWAIGRDLADRLGLDPDAPVVEWHSWQAGQAVDTGVPFGADGWRYKIVARTDATDYSARGAGDSWPAGRAPFGPLGASTGTWPPPATSWPLNQRIWMRRTLLGTEPVTITLRQDNIATLWLNGAELINFPSWQGSETRSYRIPSSALDPSGSNELVVRVTDDGPITGADLAYADVQITRGDELPAYMDLYGSQGAEGWTGGADRPLDLTGTSGVTFVWDMSYLAGSDPVLIEYGPNYNGAGERSLIIYKQGNLYVLAMTNGAGGYLHRAMNAPGPGPHRFVFVFDRAAAAATSGQIRAFIDGAEVALFIPSGGGSTSQAGTTFATANRRLFIGSRSGTSAYAHLSARPIIVITRAVTTAEALALVDPTKDPQPSPHTAPSVTAPGWVVDDARTAALAAYSTIYGRQQPTEPAGPTQATAQLVTALTGPLPAIGERFRLTIATPVAAALGLAETDRPRFTGEVTDLALDDAGTLAVVGVGRRARLGLLPAGGQPIPAETDAQRVARALGVALALPGLEVGTIDAGLVGLAWHDGSGSVGQALDDAALAAQGQLVEQRTGSLDYLNRERRRGAASKVTLHGGSELLRPFAWAQGIGSVINDATVTWAGGTVRVTDDDSVQTYGLHSTSVDTRLAAAGDAWALASDLVGRFARPTWQLPQATVELVRSLTGTKRAAVLALRYGDLLTLDELPGDGPATSTPRGVFVEGTTEAMSPSSWLVTLNLTDPALSGVALRWVDVPATETWDSTTPTLRWLDAATAIATDL